MKKIQTILLFFCCLQIFAQEKSCWFNYTFNRQVTDIATNDINNLWICTIGGLVKYNKITGEKTFFNQGNSNLFDNGVAAICITESENMWLGGTHYGVARYNENGNIIYNRDNSGLPRNQYNYPIKVDKYGNIWIASMEYMVKYDGTNWIRWETGTGESSVPMITGFDIDKDGIVWIYSLDGIGKIEDDEYEIINTYGSERIWFSGAVIVDKQNNVWFIKQYFGI